MTGSEALSILSQVCARTQADWPTHQKIQEALSTVGALVTRETPDTPLGT